MEAGEKLLLIGTNGSGKTTLLRTFSTLLSPTLGSLELFGEAVEAGKNVDFVRRRIGMLSHDTGLYEDLSIVDNLRVFAKLFGKSTDVDSLMVHVEAVGLDGRTEPIRPILLACEKSFGSPPPTERSRVDFARRTLFSA